MKRKSMACLLVPCLSMVCCFGSPLTEIAYEAVNLGGERWQYNYTVSNIGLAVAGQPAAIKEFTIWFDNALYENPEILTPPPLAGAWDEILLPPEPALGDPGAYDALAEAWNPGIGTGETAAGFSVAFDWLGTGRPGRQYYQIIDRDTFETLEDGFTIPEPAMIFLFSFGGFLIKRQK